MQLHHVRVPFQSAHVFQYQQFSTRVAKHILHSVIFLLFYQSLKPFPSPSLMYKAFVTT